MGLEEHFDEAGRAAEVAVDLEGGVFLETADVEEVGPGGLAEELENALVGGVSVFEASHAVDDPGARPAGAATVRGKTPVEGGAAGLGEVGRAARCDLVVGEEGEEVGDVTVAGFVFDVVFGPLLQVAGFADLEGWELGEDGVSAGVEIGVRGQGGGDEDFGGLQEAGEDGSGDLGVHGGGHAEVVCGAVGEAVLIFGRAGGAGDEIAGVGRSGRGGDEVIEEEEGVVSETRVGAVAEEDGVAGVVEVVPEVKG